MDIEQKGYVAFYSSAIPHRNDNTLGDQTDQSQLESFILGSRHVNVASWEGFLMDSCL